MKISKTAALRGIIFATAWLGLTAPAWATLGLRTKFAEVSADNLKIGRTYSLAETVNFPLRITNTGTDAVELSVSVVGPYADGELKPGYEPIPDLSWIRLQQSSFTVPVGMEAVTDVIVSVPNDEALLGRRFIVYLWTKSENRGATGVGLKSRLMISISSSKPTEDELKKQFVQKRLANLNFSLAPMELLMTGALAGKPIAIKDKKADVVLVSPNPEGYTFRLTSVPAWETEFTRPKEFEPGPDPKWLEIKTPVIKMKPYSILPVKLTAHIPEKFRGRKFMLVLRAEILEQDIPAYAYMKIFIETK